MKRALLFILVTISLFSQKKVLHITFHKGCAKEFEFVADELDLDLTTLFVHKLGPKEFDGVAKGSALYNVGHDRAKRVWDLHKEMFESYDLIVTSDTAPLSRIFLQNGWKKPLIIWVCNRFDYVAKCALDCSFPDKEYYHLIASTKKRPNVKVFSYTPYEHRYAKVVRGVDAWSDTIKPTGGGSPYCGDRSPIPATVDRSETFFIPPYHNDTHFMNLSAKLTSLGIPNYRGRYSGPEDLASFKGIVHIPYAWSNLALFENLRNGLIYFIPSKKFLLRLSKMSNFFWSPPFRREFVEDSEWYNPEYKDLFVFFDSWKDLKKRVETTDYLAMQERIMQFSKQHQKEMLEKWRAAIY
ncbi:MAG: hypothetical protein SNF33_04115 [Candidatus Algichlamydia australiensis]|nr:hypothetical protein [Chlamydiales bacterium]